MLQSTPGVHRLRSHSLHVALAVKGARVELRHDGRPVPHVASSGNWAADGKSIAGVLQRGTGAHLSLYSST